jgi:DNA gyrase subunit B
MNADYDIQKISPIKHVRLRPGMYIGGTDKDALHQLIYEVIANAVSEILDGYGDHIWIVLKPDNAVAIQDNGRGIEVRVNEHTGKSMLELLLTQIFVCGGPDKGYRVAGGYTGVGIQAVNALSSSCTVEVAREGYLWRQTYREGVPQSEVIQVRALSENEATGTTITFTPDYTIFERSDFQYELIAERAREIAYLMPNLTLFVRDERTDDIMKIGFIFQRAWKI